MSIFDPVIPEQRNKSMHELGHWADKTILDYFDKAVADHPDKTAVVGYVVDSNQRHAKTYREISDLSDRLAAGLLKKGITKGDVVSYQLPNSWEFLTIYLACMRIGAVTNPLMPIFRESELTYMLNFCESKIIFAPNSFRGFDYAGLMQAVQQQTACLQDVCIIDDKQGLEAFMVDEVTADDRAQFEQMRLAANDVFLLMYTSGTTGSPKGVMHTSNTHEYAARKYIERTALKSSEVVFMGSPTAHMTGLMYGVTVPIMLATTGVLLDQWKADIAWKVIHDENVAFTMGATPFLADLTDSELVDSCNHDAFRLFVCGGAPVPPALVRRASKRLKLDLMTVWGMTEMSVATATQLGDSDEKIFETDGCGFDGTEARVVGDQGEVLNEGEEGHLQLSGAGNFVGYLKRPEVFDTDAEGWFATGDLAKMIHGDYIRITGRSKDIIIRGGENIPVATVENALYKNKGIQDTAIVAKPHERLGEKACCFITLREGAAMNFAQVQQFLADEGVSKNYWPEYIEILGEMPRTASGKIQKFKLREMAEKL
ncbi:MAG: AMP-binding protein [Cycloclasticus sp.]